MDLLKYEFLDAPKGSYNDRLKELVSLIRHYRSNVPVSEYHKVAPNLQSIARWLLNADEAIGDYSGREYIEEIMQELSEEELIKDSILEEIERASKNIFKAVFNLSLSIDDVKFDFKKSEATTWVHFFGYNGEDKNEQQQQIIKNITQSICSKYGVVFIDNSYFK